MITSIDGWNPEITEDGLNVVGVHSESSNRVESVEGVAKLVQVPATVRFSNLGSLRTGAFQISNGVN